MKNPALPPERCGLPRRVATAAVLCLSASLRWGVWNASAHPAQPHVGSERVRSALRASLRESLPSATGLSSLDDLPRYDLAISLDPAASSFTVRERIDLPASLATTGEILLQVYANVGPTKPPVTFEHGECTPACELRFEAPAALLVYPGTLGDAKRLQIRLALRGALESVANEQTDLLGQALGSLAALSGRAPEAQHSLLSRGDGISLLANFYAVLGRRHGIIWENVKLPSVGDIGSDDLANYHAVVEVPASSRIVTNGVVVSTTLPSPAGARQRFEIDAPLARDFVLVESSDFDTATVHVTGVSVESHFLRRDRTAGEHVLQTAAKALEVFERRFGTYPYARLAVVEAALSGGIGGVEFSGLALVGSTFYQPFLSKSGWASLLGKSVDLGQTLEGLREFVTAHEVAHQWWHGLVGSDSRWHPFADESLAQYSSILYIEDRYGRARAEQAMRRELRSGYTTMRLLGEPDGPVDRPVTAFASPLVYGGLVYGKGPFLYRELRSMLGDKVFFEGLREYVARSRFRIADSDALFEIWSRGDTGRVHAIADRFLKEAHGDEDLGPIDVSTLLSDALGSPSLPPSLNLEQRFNQILEKGPARSRELLVH